MSQSGMLPSDNVSAARRARRAARAQCALLAVVLAVVLAPFWAVHYLPTTDGPAHLANADVVLRHFTGGAAGEAYANFYELNHLPVPNWLGHFVLALLMTALPPLVAEKVFVTALLIGLPLAVRYAVRGVRRSAGFIAFLSIPLELNWLTHQGFYNFCGSVVVFFVALGYWLRRREVMTAGRAVVLALFGFILYSGHLSSILIFCATVAILATWFTAARWLRNRGDATYSLLRDARSRVIVTGLALLPAALLAAWFQHHGFEGKPRGGVAIVVRDPAFWKHLIGLRFLVSFKGRYEKPLALATSALLALTLVVGVVHRPRRSRRDGLILVPLALVALYFTQGSQAHQELFIPQRLTLYACLTLLPFLAAQAYPLWAKRLAVFGASALAVALTAVHFPAFRAFDKQLTEYVSTGDRIDRQSTFLPLVFEPRGSPPVSDLARPGDGLRVTPFFSAQGYIAIDRKAVDLRNYEAGLDYFPVKFHPAVDPFRWLAGTGSHGLNGLMDVPQVVDIPDYERRTKATVDYVLLWCAPLPDKQDANTRRTLDYVHAHYDPVQTGGRAELWKRRNLPATQP